MTDTELAEMYRRAIRSEVIPIESKKRARPPILCAKCGNPHGSKNENSDCSLAWFYTGAKKPRQTNKNGIRVLGFQKQKRQPVVPNPPRKGWKPDKRPDTYYEYSAVYRLIDEHGHVCSYCARIDLKLTADHVIPKSRCGARTRDKGQDNLVPACQKCNGLKGNRTPLEWLIAGI